jgi:uridine kinase
MYQKFKIMLINWHTLKRVHHIMQVLKSGGMNLMTTNRTFGHLAVYCMRCVHSDLRLKVRTYNSYITMYKKVHMMNYQLFIHSSSAIS